MNQNQQSYQRREQLAARRPPVHYRDAEEAREAGRREATRTNHLWVPFGPRANGAGYSKSEAAIEDARVRAEHREAWFEGFWEALPEASPLHARRARPHVADGHAELGYALGGLSAAAQAARRGDGGYVVGNWR